MQIIGEIMVYLLAFVVVFYFLSKGKGDYKKLLEGISLEDVAPVLSAFGADSKTVDFVAHVLPEILSGNADIGSIIKSVLPLVASFTAKADSKSDPKSPDDDLSAFEEEKLTPVENFAPPEITESLNSFFE